MAAPFEFADELVDLLEAALAKAREIREITLEKRGPAAREELARAVRLTGEVQDSWDDVLNSLFTLQTELTEVT